MPTDTEELRVRVAVLEERLARLAACLELMLRAIDEGDVGEAASQIREVLAEDFRPR